MFDPLRAKAKVILYTTVAFLFGLGLASGLGWTGPSFAMPTVNSAPQVAQERIQPALDLSDAFAAIAETVTPAVVRIEVKTTRPMRSLRMPEIPEPFRQFFDLPEGDRQDHPPVPQFAGGSGFIISEDGYILTNHHVVRDADRITVYLQDRRYYEATVVGSDPTTDIAVIKIDETGLPTLSLGSSAEARVGEWVLAVGNPGFGGAAELDYTVTAGIISAKGRPLSLLRSQLRQNPAFADSLWRYAIEDFIQTDAVINRGNSGGPMVNLRGQVIGINSAIVTPTGYYLGYGFAIPIDLARRVMEDLIEYGRVRRAWLGVSIEEVSLEHKDYYGLPQVAGVVVQDVTEGAPADKAGVRQKDIIYSVDGTVVDHPSHLQALIAQRRPGDEVTLRIYRKGGRTKDIRVRLGEAPITPSAEAAPEPEARAEEKLGIEVTDLTPELAQQLGYEEAEGVVISRVAPRGPADRQAVGPGWRILEINDQRVRNTDDVKKILSDVKDGDVVSLLLEDPDGNTRFVLVRASG